LIQAFSRTNRVLNDSKPYGNILDFRQQAGAVDEAIGLFSGEMKERAKEIWLVAPAPVVIDQLKDALKKLDLFMQSQGLENAPEAVPNLKGDAARSLFVNHFKEVQRLKTQLDQYTDLTEEEQAQIEQALPAERQQSFRVAYLETAQRLKEKQDKSKDKQDAARQLDFEFVLFASAVIDYDYIMKLLARFDASKPSKQSLTPEQLISIIAADAKFMDEREDISEYIRSLKFGGGRSEQEIRAGYEAFKKEKTAKELTSMAQKHNLNPAALQTFVDETLQRLIFDGDLLSELFASLELGWKERAQRESDLMTDLTPLLKKLAGGHDVSGLRAYE